MCISYHKISFVGSKSHQLCITRLWYTDTYIRWFHRFSHPLSLRFFHTHTSYRALFLTQNGLCTLGCVIVGVCNSCPPRGFYVKNQKKTNFFYMNLDIFWLMYRSLLLFLLTQRSRFLGPFKYLEHVRKVHIKCFRCLLQKFSAQNMGFCQNIPTPFQLHFFKIPIFSFFLTYNLIGVSCVHDFALT